jgi:hypothetical protein
VLRSLRLVLASSAEAAGHFGGAFLFPAIVGLFRPNHGGRQCWETVPSRSICVGGENLRRGVGGGVWRELEEWDPGALGF